MYIHICINVYRRCFGRNMALSKLIKKNIEKSEKKNQKTTTKINANTKNYEFQKSSANNN